MIQPAVSSALATGRTTMRAGGGHGAGGDARQAFAVLLGGGGGADGGDEPAGAATLGDAAATGRQDDAATGNPAPPTPDGLDANWLSLILGGTAAPALPVADRPSGKAAASPAVAKDDAAVVAGAAAAAAAPVVAAAGPGSVARRSSDRARPDPASVLPADAPLTAAAAVVVQMRDADPEPTSDDDAPKLSVAPTDNVPAATSPTGMVDPAVATMLLDLATLPTSTTAAPVPRRESQAQAPGTGGGMSSIAGIATSGRALSGASDRASFAATPAPATVSTLGSTSVTTPVASSPAATPPGASDRATQAAMPSHPGPAEASVVPPGMTAPPSAVASLVAPAVQGIEPVPADPTAAARRSSLAEPDAAAPSQPAAVAANPNSVAPTASATPSGTVAPAGEVFAAAIQAADRQQSHTRRDGDDTATQQAMALAPASPVAGTVAAASGQGGATLNMRHPGWPGAMVEHIERLRDAADATDTRIRLVPDALGGIDVSLSRQADGVSVILAADQPATQAMLADARPQLTELAQSRGLRLADANVGGGQGFTGQGFTGQGFAGQGFADGQRRPAPGFAATASATPSTDDRDPADSRVA